MKKLLTVLASLGASIDGITNAREAQDRIDMLRFVERQQRRASREGK